jgi:putative nucleotidyltransferase with HDIG domain
MLTANLKPGMIVADNVYTSDNHLVLQENTSLTQDTIQKLRQYSIRSVIALIPDDASNGQEEPTYFERIQATPEFKEFHQEFTESLDAFQTHLNDVVVKNAPEIVDEMLRDVNSVLTKTRNPLHLLDMMQCMRGFDDSTYTHSLNVSLICHIIGNWLHFSEEDLNVLTTCGMLHDIGKLKIPTEIITKPGKLTDEEFHMIQSHPQFGYDILKDKEVDERVPITALQHHERYDGKGYPNRLSGDEIHYFSAIVSVADVYDAMTADRCYRKGICPFEVIAMLENERERYEPGILYTFMKRTVEAYINAEVLLSNGERGKVVIINNSTPSRPMVMVGNTLRDLSKDHSLKITELL